MQNTRKSFWWGLGLLVLMPLVAYIPVMKAEFIFDDRVYVTENETLRSVEGLRKIWFELDGSPQYYPFVFTSYWVEYQLWGLNGFGYHLVNVLGHILNTILLWLVLQRLGLGSAAWLAAAVFTLHPIQVESLACVSERKNILSGTFYLLVMLAYLRFCAFKRSEADCSGHWLFYGLALGFFLCALLSKTVAVSLPVVILLLLWWKHGRVGLKDVAKLIPFFVLGVILCLVTLRVEAAHFKVPAERLTQSFVEQLLVAGRALWFYVGKIFWPDNLCFIYPRWHIDAGLWWQYLFPAAAAAVMIAAWFARRWLGRGPLIAMLFFVVTLAPSLGFFKFGFMGLSFVADHFQYLACIGPIGLSACAVTVLVRRYGPRYKHICLIVGGIVLMVLGLLSWQRGHIYGEPETLWRDTIQKNPEIWTAYYNLGTIVNKQGKYEEAIRHYNDALRLNPDSSEVHCNLGVALSQLGRTEEAIWHYNEALRIETGHSKAHYNLGNIWLAQGKFNEAVVEYQKALQSKPDYIKAHLNLGVAFGGQGRIDEAIQCYREVIRLQPNSADAHYNLGAALAKQGEVEEAIKVYRKLLHIQPADAEAHCQLGVLLSEQGHLDEAIKEFQKALQINPNYAEARDRLEAALAEQSNKNR